MKKVKQGLIALVEYSTKALSGISRGYADSSEIISSRTNTCRSLKSGTLDPISGYVFNNQGQLEIGPNQWGWPSALIRRPYPIRPRTRSHLPYSYKFLASSSYYHWLMEDFPSFLRAHRAFPSNPTIVPKTRLQFVEDALQLLDLKSSILEFDDCVNFGELVYGEKAAAVEPNFESIQELKLFSNSLSSTGQSKTLRKIMVTRVPKKGRTPVNLANVESNLRERGFEILHLEKLSLRRQIEIFLNAECVVGLHGAGLANLCWSNSKVRVLELKIDSQPLCFREIVQIIGGSYQSLESKAYPNWYVSSSELDLIDSYFYGC